MEDWEGEVTTKPKKFAFHVGTGETCPKKKKTNWVSQATTKNSEGYATAQTKEMGRKIRQASRLALRRWKIVIWRAVLMLCRSRLALRNNKKR
ncbi:MAG: hypothetical protein N2381_11270, partial [Armatimonadetes bacterium]|nr:hypothetical protein [Armatimonadota bacterium]